MTARIVVLAAAMLLAQSPAPDGLERGTLPSSWVTGASCPETPAIRSHEYNEQLVIFRQSGCTNFEKPFMYLLFGSRSALLVDTGARAVDIAGPVHDAMKRWSAAHGHDLSLVVVHSHGHGDHTAGDSQFRDAPNTTLVPATPDALQRFFGLLDWPNQAAAYDLGNRIVDIIPIPGHQPASIAIYDRRTGVLLTGDTLYPGRLYVGDEAAFRLSVERLVEFTRDRPVAHVLGAHIENARTPYLDYPEGTKYQSDEHALELGRAHLLELDEALHRMNGRLVRLRLRDFTIWPLEAR